MAEDAIRYLTREEIDIDKWNKTIDNAYNGLIYAYSFYLDYMSSHWDALVMGNYDAVMPLTWNKKYGFYYLYQPAFTASLGVFGNHLTNEVISRFLTAIPAKFKLIEISLNFGNFIPAGPVSLLRRSNYVLHLRRPYEDIYRGYRENIRRNIQRSQQLGTRYEENVAIEAIIDLSKRQMQSLSPIKDSDYIHFSKLFHQLIKTNQAIACGVYLSDQLLASAVYFFSHDRAYYILVGNHPNGKTVGASHYLLDRFINDHAGKDLILDFEGSDIRSLAFFYSSFGASLEPYPYLRIDKLPWWVRVIRR
jgi:hypothetical protein